MPPTESTSDSEILLRQTDGPVTTLTLNRPNHYNALSEALLAELQHALDHLEDSCRVVVIRANGKAFCAGHDLKEMRAHPERNYYDDLFQRCSRVMKTLVAIPQPVIACVNGLATAAGCQLVANCDLAIASDQSRFAVSGINVGLFCSTPSVPLSRNVGRKKAFEWLMTGDFVDAATAEVHGLVNRTVPEAELDAELERLVTSICQKSMVAVRTGKELFYKQLELPLNDAYELAAERMACNMMAEDVGEGIDAFIEKRNAHWKHR